jgi:hypothetical protein
MPVPGKRSGDEGYLDRMIAKSESNCGSHSTKKSRPMKEKISTKVHFKSQLEMSIASNLT